MCSKIDYRDSRLVRFTEDTGTTLPTPPITEDLIALALQLDRQRRIVDLRLRRVPQWRGQLRRELHGYAEPGEIERYVLAYDNLITRAASAPYSTFDANTLREIHDASVGGAVFRNTGLIVGGHYAFPSVLEVPALVDKVLAKAALSAEPPVVAAARLHLNLVAIHPFRDGNGRTARLVAALWLVRKGFRSTLFTAVEQHFHPTPLRYLEVLDQFQYGEISEDSCVAHLLHAMVANSMYAAWFRSRELRLRGCCVARGIPLTTIDQVLVTYDADPTPSGDAAILVEALHPEERPLHMLNKTWTDKQRIELSFQVERLLDEEQDEFICRSS